MVKIEFIGGEEVVEKLRQIEPKIYTGLLNAITKLSIQLQSKVKEEKLSGQVLKTRTTNLRNSINYDVDNNPSRITGRVGTNLKYGLAHEFGFNGVVGVPAHLRKITKAWGKTIAPKSVAVKAHSRHMNLPERSFLRTALREMTPQIQSEIEKALRL